jgi:hypothetical protein
MYSRPFLTFVQHLSVFRDFPQMTVIYLLAPTYLIEPRVETWADLSV